MKRKPEISLAMGLATVTIVYAIYNRGLPSAADVRVGKPGDENLNAVSRQNAWMAAGTVAGISLLAKDPTVFILGGASVIALDWATRVNNWHNPISGAEVANPFAVNTPSGPPGQQEAPTYDGLQAVM